MKSISSKIMLNLDGSAEVSVKGFIAPIEYSQYNFHVDWDALANLRVAEPEKHYSTSIFCDFLPSHSISVGDVWEIEQNAALELLKQLHPSPSLDMRRGGGEPDGLWACLRASNVEFADIVFRIHAEFALTDGWFTPSQFTGHLVIDRINEKVVFFQMHVPKGTLNFDVNWYTEGFDAHKYITDIGYCPQIELHAGTQDVLQDAEFTEAITQEEVERSLILRFYKSEQINWVSLEEALEMAPAQQKPIHAISIDGPLADEAC